MSFLTPLFLVGALAVALPVLFHLIRRSVKERTVFSSLMFLLPSPPRLTRRSRLEHLLLLALRCLALCLLAIGFARPFLKHAFPQSQPAGVAKRVVVLLDTSASMRRQDLWNQTRAKAEDLARQAGLADAVAIFTFDRQLKPLITFEQWGGTAAGDRLSLARARLADAKPGWSTTLLDSALTQAAELFGDRAKEELPGPGQIVVISDFQEGSRVAALQGHQWPKDVEIVEQRVAPRATDNAGLQLVTDNSQTAVTGEIVTRVRVSNAANSKGERFRAGWVGRSGEYVANPVEVYVPAGQSRIVSIPAPATNVPVSRIVLQGDDEPFDNAVSAVPPGKSHLSVIYFGSDLDGNSREPLFFLQRALQHTQRQAIQIVTHGSSSPVSKTEADSAALFVVTAAVTDSQAAVLREAVSLGKTLLLAPSAPEAAASLGKILGVEPPPATEHKLDGYAMLAGIEFGHPLFAPFADSRFSDFTKIHFWKYRRMDLTAFTNARTLARFDTGDPAIVEIPAGKGRVIVLASGWHPADSQLALSSKFVPLLYGLVELSGAPPPPPAQYFVGAALPVRTGPAGANGPLSIQLPDGSTTSLRPGETNLTALEPGIYLVDSPQGPTRFAVNLEPAESRTAPMPGDELERLGAPGPAFVRLATSEADRKVRLQNTELESRQKLWRWFIVATLAVLGLETWLAGWTARRGVLREETP